MKGAVLQPGYIPWLGFFDQMNNVDLFVFYDDVQYTKRDWRNKNNIKLNNQMHPLIVPVRSAKIHRAELLIKDAQIDNNSNWRKKHVATITQAYKKAPFFEELAPSLFDILLGSQELLIDLCIQSIQWCARLLEIKTKFIFSSHLQIDPGFKKNDRLIAICHRAGIKEYLSGKAALDYLDFQRWNEAGITVNIQNYHHPIYNQQSPNFISHLSAIDLIFNYGTDARQFFMPAQPTFSLQRNDNFYEQHKN